MFLPYFKERKGSREVRTEFRGLNRRSGADENEAAAMLNLTGQGYPCLTPRGRRGRVRSYGKLNGMLGGEKLCLVDGTSFFYDGYCYGQVADSPKRMVRMGSRIVIFPDKVSFDTQTYTFSALEAHTAGTGVVATPVLADGTGFTAVESATAPGSPADGSYWLDTASGTLKQWSAAQETWVSVTTSQVRLAKAGIGRGLRAGDGVQLAGTGSLGLDGTLILQGASENAVVVTGLAGHGQTLAGTVTLDRCVPDLIYVTEANNRLWGAEAQSNELRACKLGDPSNWACYAGLSTDSYAVTVGSDGPFTGAANYGGTAIFFKERWLHKLYGTQPSNFQLTSTLACGVRQGGEGTLCQVDDALYYAGAEGVYQYDGSLPVKVSWDLGDAPMAGVSGSCHRGCYVLCARTGDDWELLVYDPGRGMWHREDAMQCAHMASTGAECWMADDGAKLLWSRGGTLTPWGDAAAGDEGALPWRMETTPQSFTDPDHKYVQRVLLRVALEAGAELDVQVRYDSEETWHTAAHVAGKGLGTTDIPLFPRRCDHYALAISGTGGAVVHTLTVERLKGRG